MTIPTNTILVITPKLSVLLSPIKDKYYRADPLGRSADAPVVGPGVHATGEEDAIKLPEKSETTLNLNAVCNTAPCRSLYRNRDAPAPKIPPKRKPSLSTNDSDNSESDSMASLPDDDDAGTAVIEGGPRSLYPKGNAVPRAHHSRNLFRDINPRNTKRGTPAVQAL